MGQGRSDSQSGDFKMNFKSKENKELLNELKRKDRKKKQIERKKYDKKKGMGRENRKFKD